MNLVLDEIKTLMEDNINDNLAPGADNRIKSFYQWEVALVPRSYLPALMVIGRSTRQAARGTAKDQVTYDVTIRVIADLVKEFTEAGTSDIIKSQETLADLMEERDSNGLASATSVLGILRRNIRGTNYLFHNDYTITYNMIQRNGFFYVAADMNFTLTTDLVLRQ